MEKCLGLLQEQRQNIRQRLDEIVFAGFRTFSCVLQLGALPLKPRYFPPSWREVLGIWGKFTAIWR